MRTRSSVLVAAVLALVVGACGGRSDSDADDSSQAGPTTTEAPAFTVTRDLVFMTVNGSEFLMNVYEPAGDGPFPVVVSFHGANAGRKDDLATVTVAEEAAAAGMVVFTPTWLTPNPFPITVATMETWDDITLCAVAFAQQTSEQYNGDSLTTIVDGFSAGAGGALVFASARPRTEPVPGCATDASPTPVNGFVLGDGEYWLHSQNFDGVFGTDPEWVQTWLASLISPSSWSTNSNAKFYLWVAAPGTNSRVLGDPPSQWFTNRDPDGSIEADLKRLDEFADGVVTYVDAGKLLALRLAEAGFDVTLNEYPGGHQTMDKAPDIVGYFQAAASG